MGSWTAQKIAAMYSGWHRWQSSLASLRAPTVPEVSDTAMSDTAAESTDQRDAPVSEIAIANEATPSTLLQFSEQSMSPQCSAVSPSSQERKQWQTASFLTERLSQAGALLL